MKSKYKLMIKGFLLLGVIGLLSACGGGGGGGAPAPVNCVLGTSAIGDCKI